MDGLTRPLALAVSAVTLMGVTPVREVSPGTLALLDPVTRIGSVCGAPGGASMRAKLAVAAAVVGVKPSHGGAADRWAGEDRFPDHHPQPQAQAYFTQGLGFAYGFNHAAAIASFREAQRIDPACAMCWWGEAMAHGPNINAPMDAGANARAVGGALCRLAGAQGRRPAERALTEAMLKRYSIDAERRPRRARCGLCRCDACAPRAAHPAQ